MIKHLLLIPVLAYSQFNYVIDLTISNQTNENLYFDVKSLLIDNRQCCKTGKTCKLLWQQNKPFQISLKNLRCGYQKCYLNYEPLHYLTIHAKHPQHKLQIAISKHYSGKAQLQVSE